MKAVAVLSALVDDLYLEVVMKIGSGRVTDTAYDVGRTRVTGIEIKPQSLFWLRRLFRNVYEASNKLDLLYFMCSSRQSKLIGR